MLHVRPQLLGADDCTFSALWGRCRAQCSTNIDVCVTETESFHMLWTSHCIVYCTVCMFFAIGSTWAVSVHYLLRLCFVLVTSHLKLCSVSLCLRLLRIVTDKRGDRKSPHWQLFLSHLLSMYSYCSSMYS